MTVSTMPPPPLKRGPGRPRIHPIREKLPPGRPKGSKNRKKVPPPPEDKIVYALPGSSIANGQILQIRQSQLVMVKRELCRRSFYDFVRYHWKEVNPEEPVWNWHIEYIAGELQVAAERVFRGEECPYDLIVNICPNSTKSTLASVMFRAWVWANMPRAKMLYTSHSGGLALTLSVKARDLVLSDTYRRLFPEIKLRQDVNNKGEWMNTMGGLMLSVGTGQNPIGRHFHFIGTDDPVNPQASAAEDATQLDTAARFQTETLPSRKIDVKTSFSFLIMQRIAQNDPTGVWLDRAREEPDRVRQICIPAELTEDVYPPKLRKKYIDGLMDPVRLPRTVLDRQRRRMGDYAYSGQYLQTPISREGGMFITDRIRECNPPIGTVWKKLIRYWDKAISTKKRACYTVGVLMGMTINPITELPAFWVLDVVRGRWASDEREALIVSTAGRDAALFGKHKVITAMEVEPGSAGEVDADATCRRLMGYIARKDKATGDKILRADAFATMVNSNCVNIAPGAWVNEYRSELQHFPNSTYKDQVDASSGAFNMMTARGKKSFVF